MKQWEYKIAFDDTDIDVVNEWGANGWEFAGNISTITDKGQTQTYLFKRPLHDNTEIVESMFNESNLLQELKELLEEYDDMPPTASLKIKDLISKYSSDKQV